METHEKIEALRKRGVLMRNHNENKEPFNDAMDHLSKIEGHQTSRTSFRQLPKGIRYLGYFFLGCFAFMFILIFLSSLLH